MYILIQQSTVHKAKSSQSLLKACNDTFVDFDIVLTLLGEILSWSLVGIKGLIRREKFSMVHSCDSEKLAYLEPIYRVNVVIMLSESLTWEHLGQCSLCKDHSKQSWLS